MDSADLRRMREKVKSVYPNKTWSRRVDYMPEDQVVAIYMRFKQFDFDPSKKRKKNTLHNEPTQLCLFHCLYRCEDCFASYVRDNPGLTECEVCGSKNILKEYI